MASLVCTSNPCPHVHDPQHMQRFQHLTPQAVPTTVAAPISQGKVYSVPENRTKCPYGHGCQLLIRGDEYHFFSYTHNHEPEIATPPTSTTTTTAAPTSNVQKVPCPQLQRTGLCSVSDPDHLAKYTHAISGNPMPVSGHGVQGGHMYNHNPYPQQQAAPFAPPTVTPFHRCVNYEGCPLTRNQPNSEVHCEQFKHKCDHGRQCKNQANPVHVRRFDH